MRWQKAVQKDCRAFEVLFYDPFHEDTGLVVAIL
jgi:hypothetical protein